MAPVGRDPGQPELVRLVPGRQLVYSTHTCAAKVKDMLPARRALLEEALQEMESLVTVWVDGNDQALAVPDLEELLHLQPLLDVRRMTPDVEPWLPTDRYPVYRLGPQDAGAAPRAGFVGFPAGFMLDALCDLAVALSRGDVPASPLARDTLRQLERDVDVKILTSPG